MSVGVLAVVDDILSAAVKASAEAWQALGVLAVIAVMRLLDAVGGVQRSVDVVLVEATVQVRGRSEGMRGERMTTSYGCSRPVDLLELEARESETGAG